MLISASLIALKEIMLAIDAISVPSPPRLTAVTKAAASDVKPDSNTADGTLENT